MDIDKGRLEDFRKSPLNILKSSSKEYFHPDIQNFVRNFAFIQEILNSKSNQQEITKTIGQKISEDKSNYERIAQGILYAYLVKGNTKLPYDYFNILRLLSSEGIHHCYSSLIFILKMKFFDLKDHCVVALPDFTDFLIGLDFHSAKEILILNLRNILNGYFSNTMKKYTEKIVEIIKKHIKWIISKSNISSLIFIKCLRMYTIYLFINEDQGNSLKQDLHFIIKSIWETKKTECLSLGRDLMRIMQEVFKYNEMGFIVNDMMVKQANGNTIFYNLLNNEVEDYNREKKILQEQLNLPPAIENLICYVLQQGNTTSNFDRCMNWVYQRFKIKQNSSMEYILVDLARYLVTVYHPPNEINDVRWICLTNIFNFCKNEFLRSFLKQSLFYDWPFYIRGKDSIENIRPGIQVISENLKDNISLSEELLEFLFVYAEQFDPSPNSQRAIQTSMRDCFDDIRGTGIYKNFEEILNHPRISDNTKKHLRDTIMLEKGLTPALPKIDPYQQENMLYNMSNNIYLNSEMGGPYNINGEFSPEKMDTENLSDDGYNKDYDGDFKMESEYNIMKNLEDDNFYPINDSDRLESNPPMEYYKEYDFKEDYSNNSVQVNVNRQFKNAMLTLESLLMKPNKSTFKDFFEEFFKQLAKVKNSQKTPAIFHDEAAKVIYNCFQNHFNDFELEIPDNVVLLIIKDIQENYQKNMERFHDIETLYRKLCTIQKQTSTIFLMYILKTGKMKDIYKDIYRGVHTITASQVLFSDLNYLYAALPLLKFNEMILANIIVEFPDLCKDNIEFIKFIVTIMGSDMLLKIENDLLQSKCLLFERRLRELIIESVKLQPYAQRNLWVLINAQINNFNKPTLKDYHIEIRLSLQAINEFNYEVATLSELFLGLRQTIINYLPKFEVEVEKYNFVGALLEYEYVPYSLLVFIIFQNISNELKRYGIMHHLKNIIDPSNPKNVNDLRNLLGHLRYWKSQNIKLEEKGQQFLDSLTKSNLTKALQKFQIEEEL